MGNAPPTTTPEEAIRIAQESGDDPGPKWDSYTGPSSITVDFTKTKRSKEELRDKIAGTIYVGNCLGDAIGLATEFMSKKEAREHYGNEISFSSFKRDFHRSRWAPGDWTDDSDQMILILDGILANGGEVSPQDFAVRLRYWIDHGFPELGDLAGCGLGGTTASVVSRRNYVNNPHSAAKEVWERSGRNAAPNGGVMRTSVLGTCCFTDMQKVIERTRAICLTTHADPRCVASCVAVTVTIAGMLCEEDDTPEKLQKIIDNALTVAKSELSGDTKIEEEFFRYVNAATLQALNLDEESSIGYTLKALGAGFVCLRNYTDFKKALTELALEGGDADTNGAVAGALLGCHLGYSKLPQDMLRAMPAKGWLDKKVERYFQLLGL